MCFIQADYLPHLDKSETSLPKCPEHPETKCVNDTHTRAH